MKCVWTIFSLVLLACFRASAQVSVGMTLEQDQFLPSESLPVAVHITNRSGQSLHLGTDTNWLTFDVESADGFIVLKNAEVPVQGEFDLGSSEVATKRVDLAPYFVLTQSGRYHIIATVRIKAWGAEVTSPPQSFDVINGAKFWSQTFGVPVPAGAGNQPPEVRTYTLEQANYLRSQLRLYALISNESASRVFKVIALGRMVSFGRPEAQLDELSNLHVLWQSGASVFSYAVVSPDGAVLQREIYDYINTHPRLGTNDRGDIVVIGGARRVEPEPMPDVKSPDEVSPPVQP
jgi:hypothetical protein